MASKATLWIGRVISAVPVLLMTMSATMKFMKVPAAVQGFKDFGYMDHHLLPLAITEISCVVIYLIPQTAVLGAILMTGYLGGAVATHVRKDDPMFVMAVLMGVLVWLGLLLREKRLRPLLPFRS